MAPSADRRAQLIARLDIVGLVVTSIGAVILLAYLLGSMFLTGGQLSRFGDPLHDLVLMDWPVFEVPAWLSIAIGAVALLAFVPMAAMVRPEETGRLVRALGMTSAGSLVQSFVMLLAFPVVVGTSSNGVAQTVPSLHWVGLLLGAVTMVLVFALGYRAMAEQGRRLRA